MTSGLPPITWQYYDCGDSVGRNGTDGDPSTLPPIPAGCFEVDYDQYVIRKAEINGSIVESAEAMAAADRQAEDDRISDLVAVKVAELLAARDGTGTA